PAVFGRGRHADRTGASSGASRHVWPAPATLRPPRRSAALGGHRLACRRSAAVSEQLERPATELRASAQRADAAGVGTLAAEVGAEFHRRFPARPALGPAPDNVYLGKRARVLRAGRIANRPGIPGRGCAAGATSLATTFGAGRSTLPCPAL